MFHLIQNDQGAVPGTICVAVYRPDVELLGRQIVSIRDQSETRWHCHVGIDGSDAATTQTLRDLIGNDSRFTVHEFADNVGFYRNFERLLGVVDVNSPWVALADQDDYWYPQKLERLLSALLVDGVSLVSGQARVVNRDGIVSGQTRRHARNLAALMLDNQITGSFSAFKPSILSSSLPFPDPTDVAYHDHWLGVVASCFGEIVFMDEILQDYTQHGNNVIGEETGANGFAKRVSSLVGHGNGVGGSIRYISGHRWGWRVEMAAVCLSRIPLLAGSNTRLLKTFAKGRLTLPLLRVVISGIARRDVRPARGVALLVGAAAARPNAN